MSGPRILQLYGTRKILVLVSKVPRNTVPSVPASKIIAGLSGCLKFGGFLTRKKKQLLENLAGGRDIRILRPYPPTYIFHHRLLKLDIHSHPYVVDCHNASLGCPSFQLCNDVLKARTGELRLKGQCVDFFLNKSAKFMTKIF